MPRRGGVALGRYRAADAADAAVDVSWWARIAATRRATTGSCTRVRSQATPTRKIGPSVSGTIANSGPEKSRLPTPEAELVKVTDPVPRRWATRPAGHLARGGTDVSASALDAGRRRRVTWAVRRRTRRRAPTRRPA